MSNLNVLEELQAQADRRMVKTQAPKSPVLNSQKEWNLPLQKLRSHIIQGDERGLPRYGVLSILARRVPFHLYDHPAMMAACDSAFTDGIHVFVNTEFFKEITAEDKGDGSTAERRHSMLLILLHELCHILFRHHGRFPPHAPPLLWAIATDIAINSRLLKNYPALKPGPVFDSAWGTKPDEIKQYLGQSEEHILYGLWEDPPASAKGTIYPIKDKMQQGAEAVTQGDDQRGEPQDIHNHMMSPEDLAELMDNNGLKSVRQTLKLPDANDSAAQQQLQLESTLRLHSDLDTAKDIRENHPAGMGMAGKGVEQDASEWVKTESEKQLDWKNLLQDRVLGEGMLFEHCEEEPADIYYVSPEAMGLEAPLYLGSPAPATHAGVLLVVIDTSASVSSALLGTFMAELKGLLSQESIKHSRVFMTSADNQLKGEFTLFGQNSEAELPEQLELYGRGGTDIATVVKHACEGLRDKEGIGSSELDCLVYFSDLLDTPPKREQLPEALPKLLFLTPPSPLIKPFKRGVEAFATVAEIKDGTVIELCRT